MIKLPSSLKTEQEIFDHFYSLPEYSQVLKDNKLEKYVIVSGKVINLITYKNFLTLKFKNYSYPEDFYFANNQLFLTKLGRQKSAKYRRKITGSRIAAVIGRNKYKSPFQC